MLTAEWSGVVFAPYPTSRYVSERLWLGNYVLGLEGMVEWWDS
jgi:hypothetical protein